MSSDGIDKLIGYLSKLMWPILVGIVSMGVSEIKEMSKSINVLNTNVAVLLSKISYHEERLSEIYKRIDRLENHPSKPRP